MREISDGADFRTVVPVNSECFYYQPSYRRDDHVLGYM